MEAFGRYFDELARAGSEHLDPEYVAAYDRKTRTDPADDLALLRNLGLDDSSILVDFGAGTGTLALAAAPFCRRVVAVDVSSAMLAVLRRKSNHLGLRNVECAHGGFLTYEHRGDRADFVYSRNALHHLPDFWKVLALERIAALVKPDGVLRLRDLVFCVEPSQAGRTLGTWLAAAPQRPEDGWTRAELETHVREEYSTFSWLLELMLERVGFKVREAEYSASKVFAAYTCMRESS